MKIQKVTDPAFRKYGQVLEGYDFTSLIKEMKHTPVPEDVIYVPSVEELEALDVMKKLQNKGYGGLPIPVSYTHLDVYKRQGYVPNLVDNDQVKELRKDPYVKNMPCYPDYGSIAIYKDTVIIKLSD